ncbi:MAG: lipid-A-disaccharide synthase [Elusimicrobiota bacterium]|jgi:lipid-A-disaccharide synthase|nr:lipid-A-disaccharide synthase [Elusimicrobiota bacterium]
MSKIFVSAGDLSGEIHLTNLVKEIKKIEPSVHIIGEGGQYLKEVCGEFVCDIVNINAFGFLPIKQIFFLKKVLKQIKKIFLEQKIDKVILTDYYGFHIIVARLAKSLNIPVYYFISPQVWASRIGRIEKLKQVVKKMLVIFPFEEKLYRDRGVDAVFVGHPLIDKVAQKENFNITQPPIIGLFPGSRKDTIKRHLPIILETAKILKEKLNANFVMFSASQSQFLNANFPEYIRLANADDWDTRKSIDIAICPSGTVSLENALLGIPMAVMYKLSNFNYFFIKAIIKVKYITIVNILAGKSIVPEFIQFDAFPQKIANNIIKQLAPQNYQNKTQEILSIRKIFGSSGAVKRAADIILSGKCN